jgi:hypothetical protein
MRVESQTENEQEAIWARGRGHGARIELSLRPRPREVPLPYPRQFPVCDCVPARLFLSLLSRRIFMCRFLVFGAPKHSACSCPPPHAPCFHSPYFFSPYLHSYSTDPTCAEASRRISILKIQMVPGRVILETLALTRIKSGCDSEQEQSR